MAEPKLAPDRNPDVGRPAVPHGVSQTIRPRVPVVARGAELVPDLAARGRQAGGTIKEYRYWIGVSPSCPVEHIDVAGLNFPKVNENLIDDPMRTTQKKRVPVIGAIVFMSEAKIRLLRERLPRTVIRFTDDAGEAEEPGTGMNIGDNHRRPRRGHVITIPTDEEVAQRRRDGQSVNLYVPHKNDVPAARFMFAQLCADQANGSRGDVYPESLEVTGLEWPDELDDLLN